MNHVRDAKELLEKYNDLKHSLVEMRERYEVLDGRLTGIKSQDYGQLFTESNPNNDVMINMIYEKNMLEKSIKETEEETRRIDAVMSYLGDDGEILRLIFIQEKPWQQIEIDLHISRSQLFKKRKQALHRFAIQLFGIRGIA